MNGPDLSSHIIPNCEFTCWGQFVVLQAKLGVAGHIFELTKTSIPVFGPSVLPLYISGMLVLGLRPAFSERCLAITSKDLANLA